MHYMRTYSTSISVAKLTAFGRQRDEQGDPFQSLAQSLCLLLLDGQEVLAKEKRPQPSRPDQRRSFPRPLPEGKITSPLHDDDDHPRNPNLAHQPNWLGTIFPQLQGQKTNKTRAWLNCSIASSEASHAQIELQPSLQS